MKRIVLRVLAGLVAALAVLSLVLLGLAWQGLGARATGARRVRMERSPQWRDGRFANPEPIVNHYREMLSGLFEVSPNASPSTALPVVHTDPALFTKPPASGVRVTWLGHSSTLIELDGARVLTDPSWSERSSPIAWLGPTRWFAPPLALDALPPIDAVVISHDHYDHLDHRTIAALATRAQRFVVPLGIGAHLASWGVPEERIVELDWWEHTAVGPLRITCTPARHASGRALWDRDQNLWAGWALRGPEHAVFFSGDTGLFSALREIGARLGPFDVTMIEVGQYHAGWPDWHIGPEQAVRAHQWLRGRVLVPVHWGRLQLAYHGWTEPIERTLAAARVAHVPVVAPRPGESVEPLVSGELAPWWPSVPWQSASEAPIVSGGLGAR
jgi:L-ascorbate metabolism protein UlaG (beta-lactamase superfamily)